MAKNHRRAPVHRLSPDRIRLGCLTWIEAHVASGAPGLIPHQLGCNQQITPDENSNEKELTVPVIFHIPGGLREYTGGQKQLVIEGTPSTLADALQALWGIYPGLRDRILTEQRQVREHINIFIGDENVRYTGGLMTPIPSAAEISIVPAISGGT